MSQSVSRAKIAMPMPEPETAMPFANAIFFLNQNEMMTI